MVDIFRIELSVVLEVDGDVWTLLDLVNHEAQATLRTHGLNTLDNVSFHGQSVEKKNFERRSIWDVQEAFSKNHATAWGIHGWIHTNEDSVFLVSLFARFITGQKVDISISGHDRMATDRYGHDLRKRLSESERVARLSPKAINIGPLTVSSRDSEPEPEDTFKPEVDKLLAELASTKHVRKENPVPKAENHKGSSSPKNEIFIVHGHDDLARLQVSAALQQLTGLVPVVLHEQRSGGKTVIEKLQEAAAQAVCAVVLLTPDDFGGKVDGDSKPRARQNVVFEFGYFAALLGRENVIALTQGGVEIPSDLNGVVYISMDTTDWKLKLATELRGISSLTVDSNALR